MLGEASFTGLHEGPVTVFVFLNDEAFRWGDPFWFGFAGSDVFHNLSCCFHVVVVLPVVAGALLFLLVLFCLWRFFVVVVSFGFSLSFLVLFCFRCCFFGMLVSLCMCVSFFLLLLVTWFVS